MAFGGREARKLSDNRGLSRGQVQGMRDRLNYGPDFAGVHSGTDLEDDAIVSRHVAPNAVGSVELASGADDSFRAVGNSHIQTDAVSNSKISAGAVDNGELAGGSVSNSKIGSGEVSDSKIGDMDGVKLHGSSVDSSRLANVNGGLLLANSVADSKIINMAGSKITDNSINGVSKILTGSITPAELDRAYAASAHNHDAAYVNLTEVSKNTSGTLAAGTAWVVTPTTSAI